MQISETHATDNPSHLDTVYGGIARKLAGPQGFASLSTDERRFTFALLLAGVVPADRKVKSPEIERLGNILQTKYGLKGELFTKAIVFARGEFASRAEFQSLAKRLPDMLSIDDRCELIGAMWDVALSDNELHELEHRLILEIADTAGIPRKRTREQQARAASRQQ